MKRWLSSVMRCRPRMPVKLPCLYCRKAWFTSVYSGSATTGRVVTPLVVLLYASSSPSTVTLSNSSVAAKPFQLPESKPNRVRSVEA